MAVYNTNVLRGTAPTFDTTNASANPLIPVEYQREIIAGATQKSICGRLLKHMPMGSTQKQMAVLDSKATAYFVSEGGLKQTSLVGWRNVIMTAEDIACIIPIHENVINDASIDLWGKIRPEVEEAIGRALDAAILVGTQKPSTWAAAIAPQAITAGNVVTQGVGIDIAADVNNVLAALEADGYPPMQIAMIQSLRSAFRGLRSTTNEFIFQPNEPGAANTAFGTGAGATEGRIFDIPAISVLNGVFEDAAGSGIAKLIVGDWSQGMLGVRQDVTVSFSNSAVIQNDAGDIVFNAYQQDMVLARFVSRFGWAVPNPTNRTNSTTAPRWPWATLRAA